jgi:hypothetical protein
VLALAVPAVGESIRVYVPAYTPPSNAYWQITTDDFVGNVLGCVVEGQDHYGNGDDCSIYNTDTVDFTGASVINFEFDISLVTDSDNDHCVFQMKDSDDPSWTTIDYFAADTDGWEHRTYDFVCGGLGDWSACDSVYFRFRWVSDGSGTDLGIRIDDLSLDYGDIGYKEERIFSWGDGMIQTHEVWDLSPWLTAGDDFFLEWYYYKWGTGVDAFWGIDDPWVYDADGDLMGPEPFDDWLPDGWHERGGSSAGRWEQESVTGWRDPLGPSGSPIAACDGGNDTDFDASLYSPLICDITNDAVTVDFYSSFECEQYSRAVFCLWHGDLTVREFADDFEHDLSLWTVLDEGSGNLNVIPSSVGKIKAAYR